LDPVIKFAHDLSCGYDQCTVGTLGHFTGNTSPSATARCRSATMKLSADPDPPQRQRQRQDRHHRA
jgi:hypothetical protein